MEGISEFAKKLAVEKGLKHTKMAIYSCMLKALIKLERDEEQKTKIMLLFTKMYISLENEWEINLTEVLKDADKLIGISISDWDEEENDE